MLTFLLNAHPQVATVGELAPTAVGDLDRYRCSCGAGFKECGFWQWLCQAAREQGIPFRMEDFGTRFWMPESAVVTRLLRPLHRGPGLELLREAGLHCHPAWNRRRQAIARANTVVVRLVLGYYQSRMFVDKGNTALRLKHLLRIPAFDVSVIRLIRDGRAVTLAHMNPAQFADARNPDLRGDRVGEGKQLRAAAYEWRRSNEEAEHALARLDDARKIEVRYERLCVDTDAEMRRIFAFLGLDEVRRAGDFRSVEHHVVGNGMRLDAISEVSLDERWRSVLSAAHLREFDAVAGEMNRRYGYE